jgi:hypothetical protein
MSTNSDPSPDCETNDEHRGYDLESGLIARVREWTDVFPWIRLARTLRASASPPMLLVTALLLFVWGIGQSLISASLFDDLPEPVGPNAWTWSSQLANFGELSLYLKSLIPASLFTSGFTGVAPAEVVWAVFVWIPGAMILARQGALLTAGRPMMGLKTVSTHVFHRTLASWFAAFIPLACAAMLSVFVMLLGALSRIVVFSWIEYVIAALIVVVAIPCGILVFGANIAVPLSWSALAIEENPDPLDSLSRGYEYLLRRPLKLILYLLIASVLAIIVALFASLIGHAAEAVVRFSFDLVGAAKNTQLATIDLLRWFPRLVWLTQMGTLCGGVYLLLRYDAGGQEVEDIWQPTPEPRVDLPELPQTKG